MNHLPCGAWWRTTHRLAWQVLTSSSVAAFAATAEGGGRAPGIATRFFLLLGRSGFVPFAADGAPPPASAFRRACTKPVHDNSKRPGTMHFIGRSPGALLHGNGSGPHAMSRFGLLTLTLALPALSACHATRDVVSDWPTSRDRVSRGGGDRGGSTGCLGDGRAGAGVARKRRFCPPQPRGPLCARNGVPACGHRDRARARGALHRARAARDRDLLE